MERKEKIDILLDCIDRYAPTNINWNLKSVWEKALEKGLKKIEEKENKENAK